MKIDREDGPLGPSISHKKIDLLYLGIKLTRPILFTSVDGFWGVMSTKLGNFIHQVPDCSSYISGRDGGLLGCKDFQNIQLKAALFGCQHSHGKTNHKLLLNIASPKSSTLCIGTGMLKVSRWCSVWRPCREAWIAWEAKSIICSRLHATKGEAPQRLPF